ncbi:MAG TPA: hypothetical protein DCQ64_04920 [Candidatus Rokubacteria bacterium]|nr:hypothetical protein [Candidatus Rokubacteria bacterium]
MDLSQFIRLVGSEGMPVVSAGVVIAVVVWMVVRQARQLEAANHRTEEQQAQLLAQVLTGNGVGTRRASLEGIADHLDQLGRTQVDHGHRLDAIGERLARGDARMDRMESAITAVKQFPVPDRCEGDGGQGS